MAEKARNASGGEFEGFYAIRYIWAGVGTVENGFIEAA